MIQRYLNQFIALLLFLMIASVVYLQYSIKESTKRLKDEEISQVKQYAEKIAILLQSKLDVEHIATTLKENPSLRHELNTLLQAFLIHQYQYIYLLKKDKEGHFRFMLDGSKKNPEPYGAIFFPKSDNYVNIRHSRQVRIVERMKGVEGVWFSVVYPIVHNQETKALLVLDLSESYGNHIENFNTPLLRLVGKLQWILWGGLLLLLIIVYRYHRYRKSVLIDKTTKAHTLLYLEEFFNRNSLDQYHAVLLDIDEFRKINEKHGVASGDRILREFVETIRDTWPDRGLEIIKTSGTEFFIALPKKKFDIDELVPSLFALLEGKKYLAHNEVVRLTISMSAMKIPKESKTLNNILRLLDEKLLEIKSHGKNAFSILGTQSAKEMEYADRNYIQKALDAQRLLCLYQPIFTTRTKEIVKFEALVRLVDEEDSQKLISPFYFMRTIRGTSQYIKMSRIVLQRVFETLLAYPDTEISVNLDLDDLYSNEMMTLINESLHAHRHIADRLTFEIIEEKEIYDFDRVGAIFGQLRAYGSKIAIDDFGSGYANYSYLIELDIDILKIDGSLIQKLQTELERTRTVLRSINDIAQEHRYELVAEFVSSEAIYEAVKGLDIAYSQGFYLGKPKPIETYLGKPTR